MRKIVGAMNRHVNSKTIKMLFAAFPLGTQHSNGSLTDPGLGQAQK
jgi:hypothetical protein